MVSAIALATYDPGDQGCGGSDHRDDGHRNVDSPNEEAIASMDVLSVASVKGKAR